MPDLKEYRASKNIVELLPKKKLDEISTKVLHGFEIDKLSRAEWETSIKKALKIAKQVFERKSTPFENASNVKYPLIAKAGIDYAARTYPELIQGGRVVHAKVIGDDPDFAKAERAARVAQHMSYQLLDESSEWEDGLDHLLHMLPIFGTVFRKVFYNPIEDRNISQVIDPDHIVVNQGIRSLEAARRVTHVLFMHPNDVVERQRAGLYSECDLDILRSSPQHEEIKDTDQSTTENDDDALLTVLEQHCYLDLDDDGYQEPYIVTLHKESGKILRIFHRYKEVERKNGEVKRIVPEQYFVDYHFIKSPDGDYYSIGFGTLLLPINESINTVINQLVDSGTLANQQSGFVGRGLRLRAGSMTLKQGEWKILDSATGIDLKSNIVPIPTKEPSQTLFALLGLLIDVGQDMSSINDILQGKQPAQNVPATTILTLAEQGLKVFNAITKRLYRSMRKEFRRLFDLNRRFLSDKEYQKVLDSAFASIKDDYNIDLLDIVPVADPAVSSDAQRLARARALLDLPTVDPLVASRLFLQALQFEDPVIDALLPIPDPNAPPEPDTQKTLAEVDKLGAEAQKALAEIQIEAAKVGLQESDVLTRAAEAQARIDKMQSDSTNNTAKVRLAARKASHEAEIDEANALLRNAEREDKANKEELNSAIDTLKVIGDSNEQEDKDN